MYSQQQRTRGIRVLKAVSSAIRLQILNLLSDRGELSYTELMNLLKLSPSRDAGRFAYHLRFLLKAGLVEVAEDSKKYRLTDLGKMVLEVAEEIEKKGLKSQKILVRTSRFTLEEFDVNRIVDSLVREAGMPVEQAKKVAKEAEKRLLKAKTKYLTAPLIREVVNGILIEKGFEEYRHKLTRLGLPVHDVTQALSRENAFNSASAVHEEFGKNVIAEYTLLNVLPRDVADAHLSGRLHLENLGDWILKPKEVVHDLRFFFKKAPPKTFESALNLTFNVLLHSAKEVSGTQTLEYFNVFLAPFMKGLKLEEAKEALKLFISNLSSHVDVSLNIELTVPDFLAAIPIAENQSTPPQFYGDLVDECMALAQLTLEVFAEESLNKPILNPKVVVKLRPEAFKEKAASSILYAAHSLAAGWSLPYFASNIEENERHTVFSSSGVKFKANFKGDWEIDTLRTGVLGKVTVNIPRMAYESGGDEGSFFERLKETLEPAIRALEIKFKTVKQSGKGFQSFLAQTVNGDHYFRMENSACMINIAGLMETSEIFTGKSVYESEECWKFAAETMRHVSDFLHESNKRRDRRLLPSHVPSQEASLKLARQDVERFGVAKVRFHGTREKPYYLTFNRVSVENLEKSLKILAAWRELYPHLAGGMLTVIELGESEHKVEELLALTRKLVENYGVEFFTYNRNLTYCGQCRKSMFGILHKCPNCGSVGTLTVFGRYP
ncbi:MAG: anaerobic ribonucleoside-triphosphate reductase [Candidatus Bathyarchaeia archaeon]